MKSCEILNKMTLEEKVSLLAGESFFGSREIKEYGINRIQFLDGGTGMNFEQLFGDLYKSLAIENGYTFVEFDNVTRYFYEVNKLSSREKDLRDLISDELIKRTNGFTLAPACYPPGILLGSTWNKDAIYKVGRALGMEALLYRVECLLGTPNVNLLRDPRNGRFFEGYSEDPFLTGELGVELLRGVEEEGVASNVKHFCANNLEINRSGINQIISKRALMELYLPHFKKCLQSGAATVMTSYPSINGKPCVNDSWLLREILRDEWNYTGVNMTDWGAVTGDSGDAVASGIDLLMPGPWSFDGIIEAVKDGRISEEKLNGACERMISFVLKYSRKDKDFPYSEEYYLNQGDSASYEAASEGIVMLKNENDLFPIKKNSSELILFGPDDILICGGGSAQVFTNRKLKFSEGIENLRVEDYECFNTSENAIALVILSIDSKEGSDRVSLDMDEKTTSYLNKLIELKNNGAKGKIALILNTPGPVILKDYIDKIDAVFAVFYPGSMGVKALIDIMYGDINPSGKLTSTWPLKIEDMPSYLCYPDGFTSYYGEGIFVGYRGYEKSKKEPLFPFGFGLSYSEFEFENIRTDKLQYSKEDSVKVTLDVKNISLIDGMEVVELYVGDKVSRKIKPTKELKAFKKVFIKANSKEEITLEFSCRDLASFDEDYGKFIVEDGLYDIYIGNSSLSAKNVATIRITDGDLEYRMGLNTPIRILKEIPELYSALVKEIREKKFDEIELIMAERYTPAMNLREIYKNSDELSDFTSLCNLYKKT